MENLSLKCQNSNDAEIEKRKATGKERNCGVAKTILLNNIVIQWNPVNPPVLGPKIKWRINRNGGLTEFFLVIQRAKLEILDQRKVAD